MLGLQTSVSMPLVGLAIRTIITPICCSQQEKCQLLRVVRSIAGL